MTAHDLTGSAFVRVTRSDVGGDALLDRIVSLRADRQHNLQHDRQPRLNPTSLDGSRDISRDRDAHHDALADGRSANGTARGNAAAQSAVSGGGRGGEAVGGVLLGWGSGADATGAQLDERRASVQSLIEEEAAVLLAAFCLLGLGTLTLAWWACARVCRWRRERACQAERTRDADMRTRMHVLEAFEEAERAALKEWDFEDSEARDLDGHDDEHFGDEAAGAAGSALSSAHWHGCSSGDYSEARSGGGGGSRAASHIGSYAEPCAKQCEREWQARRAATAESEMIDACVARAAEEKARRRRLLERAHIDVDTDEPRRDGAVMGAAAERASLLSRRGGRDVRAVPSPESPRGSGPGGSSPGGSGPGGSGTPHGLRYGLRHGLWQAQPLSSLQPDRGVVTSAPGAGYWGASGGSHDVGHDTYPGPSTSCRRLEDIRDNSWLLMAVAEAASGDLEAPVVL